VCRRCELLLITESFYDNLPRIASLLEADQVWLDVSKTYCNRPGPGTPFRLGGGISSVSWPQIWLLRSRTMVCHQIAVHRCSTPLRAKALFRADLDRTPESPLWWDASGRVWLPAYTGCSRPFSMCRCPSQSRVRASCLPISAMGFIRQCGRGLSGEEHAPASIVTHRIGAGSCRRWRSGHAWRFCATSQCGFPPPIAQCDMNRCLCSGAGSGTLLQVTPRLVRSASRVFPVWARAARYSLFRPAMGFIRCDEVHSCIHTAPSFLQPAQRK